MTDHSRLQAMRALLAKAEPDGLDELRRVRILYPRSDGRERIGWHERLKFRLRRTRGLTGGVHWRNENGGV